MKQTVEAQVSSELTNNPDDISTAQNDRKYHIKYLDGDNELINVSDDEDLYAAYDVAKKDLNGNLKFIIELKQKYKVIKKRDEAEKKDKKEKKEKKDKKCKHKHFKEEEKEDASVGTRAERDIKKCFSKIIKSEIEQIGKDVLNQTFTG